MTLPTLDKTWQFNVNLDAGGTGAQITDNELAMYAIKSSLVGFASSPWVVWGSRDWDGVSGGAAGNNDYVDRWTAPGKLVGAAAGSNHAWAVLEQPGLGNAQVCIDIVSANGSVINLVFSPGGNFGAAGSGGTGADGTLTARPTAGDEQLLISGASWGGSSSAYYTKGIHVMQSSDGQCTRMAMCIGNVCCGLWIIERAKNPIAAWTTPNFAGAIGAGATEVATYANWNDAARCNSRIGTAAVTFYMTSAFYGSATVGENQTYPDDNSLEWPINSIGLASLTAAHRGGRKGEVFDLYWGSTAVQIGTTYPEDGTKQFAQFGHLVFPWNGTTPKMT